MTFVFLSEATADSVHLNGDIPLICSYFLYFSRGPSHYIVHWDDSVDEDEVNCHGNGDDYDSKTTIKEAQKKRYF